MELNKAVIFLILSLGTACIARAQNDGAVAPDTRRPGPLTPISAARLPQPEKLPIDGNGSRIHTGTCRLLTCQPSCLTQIGRS